MSEGKSKIIEWSSTHFGEFVRVFIQSCKQHFGVTESRPIGIHSHNLERLGNTYGYKMLINSITQYFNWLKDNNKIPSWQGFLISAEMHIKQVEQLEFIRNKNRKAREQRAKVEAEKSKNNNLKRVEESNNNSPGRKEFLAVREKLRKGATPQLKTIIESPKSCIVCGSNEIKGNLRGEPYCHKCYDEKVQFEFEKPDKPIKIHNLIYNPDGSTDLPF